VIRAAARVEAVFAVCPEYAEGRFGCAPSLPQNSLLTGKIQGKCAKLPAFLVLRLEFTKENSVLRKNSLNLVTGNFLLGISENKETNRETNTGFELSYSLANLPERSEADIHARCNVRRL
jgi:hypothetical protein